MIAKSHTENTSRYLGVQNDNQGSWPEVASQFRVYIAQQSKLSMINQDDQVSHQGCVTDD